MVSRSCTVRFPQGVSACNQRHSLLVVHAHPAKRLADVVRGKDRIGVAIGSLWIHVDEPHLDCRQWVFKLAVSLVPLVGKPFFLCSPVHVFLRLPHIRTPTAESEGFKAHGLERHVAGKDHQIRP